MGVYRKTGRERMRGLLESSRWFLTGFNYNHRYTMIYVIMTPCHDLWQYNHQFMLCTCIILTLNVGKSKGKKKKKKNKYRTISLALIYIYIYI